MGYAKKKEKKLTYSDYCELPEDERYELINGVLFDMTPAPSRQHSLIVMELGRQFANHFLGKTCEVHCAPFDVRLPANDEPDEETETVVQPDIVVVCDKKKLDNMGCRGAPDLVIEVLSPSTAPKDFITKKALFEGHKVKEYWLVHPTDRIVTIFKLNENGVFGVPLIYDRTSNIIVGLFGNLEIDLSLVFPADEPKVVRDKSKRYL